MLFVKAAHEGHARDSLFCCVKFWITCMINTCHFEGTRELVAHKHQVAFELYRKPSNNNMVL